LIVLVPVDAVGTEKRTGMFGGWLFFSAMCSSHDGSGDGKAGGFG